MTTLTAQQVRTHQALRRRTIAKFPAVRQNTANIIRSLRRSFKRPLWMEPNTVPAMIRAMARQLPGTAALCR
jgi:hypothetical protein